MSREVRRVPMNWQHPTVFNEYWVSQSRPFMGKVRPPSRLHAPDQRFVGLMSDYVASLARWETEGADLAAREGHHWWFSLKWHLTGVDDCSCHPGSKGMIHPAYFYDESDSEVSFEITNEDALHAHLTVQHDDEWPDPADYMPVFDVPEDQLGWCLYETVSEGTPCTPVFATAEELIDHLSTVGQDWDQVPLRRSSAEALVAQGGSFGSMVAIGGRLLDSTTDADLITEATS